MRLFYAGSFDPPTLGHLAIVERALMIASELVIGIGHNSAKQPLFTTAERLALWQRVIAAMSLDKQARVRVIVYQDLLVQAAREAGADAILRALRGPRDLEAEQDLAYANQLLQPDLETVYLLARPTEREISSSLARELVAFGADLRGVIPESIRLTVQERARRSREDRIDG